jgi:hypothetical protein
MLLSFFQGSRFLLLAVLCHVMRQAGGRGRIEIPKTAGLALKQGD